MCASQTIQAPSVLIAGALVGPPWAKRENGFVFTEQVPDGITLYYEPHCDYDESSLAGVDSADIVITPCVNQELLNYPLVRQIRTVKLFHLVSARSACLLVGQFFAPWCALLAFH